MVAVMGKGDIIDELPPYIWIPVVNTVFFILFVLCIVVYSTWKLLKIDCGKSLETLK
jgi:hypothetical protein